MILTLKAIKIKILRIIQARPPPKRTEIHISNLRRSFHAKIFR